MLIRVDCGWITAGKRVIDRASKAHKKHLMFSQRDGGTSKTSVERQRTSAAISVGRLPEKHAARCCALYGI